MNVSLADPACVCVGCRNGGVCAVASFRRHLDQQGSRVNPQEHYSEAKRLASKAESMRRQPGAQFDAEPWLKAQTHALLALYGLIAAVSGVRQVTVVKDETGEAE